MPPKNENWPFFTTSVDDWLDEKKKQDGAEGLWRIGDKLYDFTVWARDHPGGQFWINTTRGTDITEAFENHHFSTNAESLLQNYYKKDASSPKSFFTTFSENGFYKKFKGRVLQQYPRTDVKPHLRLLSMNDGLVAAVFLTGLLGTNYGIIWSIAAGILLGLLTIFSHSFLHMKDNWRIYYFDMSLMSSREWRIRHVLSHHQYRSTTSDLEIPVWQPFSKTQGLLGHLNFLLFPVAAHLQFIRRCLDVLLSKKLAFYSEELVPFSLPLFLFLLGGAGLWKTFVIWNQIILIGSFVYCFFNSAPDKFDESNSQMKWEPDTKGNDKDFGIVQLSLVHNHPKEHESAFSILNSFRGNVLHYLCPSVGCENLSKLTPIFDEICDEYGISLSKTSKGFPEGIQEAVPEGHVFFS